MHSNSGFLITGRFRGGPARRLWAVAVMLVLLASVLAPVSAQAVPARAALAQEDFDCPASDGTFEHEDLSKFWHCSNHYAYEKDCALANPPLVFVADERGAPFEGRCEWPSEAPDPIEIKGVSLRLSAPRGVAVGGRITYTLSVAARQDNGAGSVSAIINLPRSLSFTSGTGCDVRTAAGTRNKIINCVVRYTGTRTATARFTATTNNLLALGPLTTTARYGSAVPRVTDGHSIRSSANCQVSTGLVVTC